MGGCLSAQPTVDGVDRIVVHGFDAVIGIEGNMRCDDHRRMMNQRIIQMNIRFMLQYIQESIPDFAAVERCFDRRFIKQRATGGIHQNDTVLHVRNGPGIDHPLRRGKCRHMQSKNIAAPEELFQSDVFHPVLLCQLQHAAQVNGKDVHGKAVRYFGNKATDVACSDNTDRLAVQTHAAQPVIIKTPFRNALLPLLNMTHGGKEECKHMLGNHMRAVVRHVADHNTALPARIHINVIIPDGPCAQQLQRWQLIQNGARERGDERGNDNGILADLHKLISFAMLQMHMCIGKMRADAAFILRINIKEKDGWHAESIAPILATAMSFTVRRLRDDKKERRPFPWNKWATRLLKLSGPILAFGEILYAEAQKKAQEQARKKERINLLKRVLVVLITVLCAALLFAATVKALVDLKVLNLRSLVSVAATDLPMDSFGHTNVLLLGKGDANHDGIDLTDTIMIASIDPGDTKSVALLSLPRDLYFLQTEKMGKGRINTLYRDYKNALIRDGMEKETAETEALTEVAAEIGRTIGLDIHEALMVDFQGFVEAVDAIGGVDIEVPETLIDTEYPDPMNESAFITFEVQAGLQHLDGETALKYARSRHSTSDFDRSRRQQQILQAIGEQLKSGGVLSKPSRILDLVNILEEHVETTLTVREMLGLAKMGGAIEKSNLITMQLNDQNGLYGAIVRPGGLLYSPPRAQFGGASVLLPVSIPPDPITWQQINLLTTLFSEHREMFTDRTPIDVLNAGAKPGSGRRQSDELEKFGFTIGRVANSDNGEKLDTSVVRATEENRVKATFIADALQMKLEILSPEMAAGIDTSAIVILLGKDYTYTPLQSSFQPRS